MVNPRTNVSPELCKNKSNSKYTFSDIIGLFPIIFLNCAYKFILNVIYFQTEISVLDKNKSKIHSVQAFNFSRIIALTFIYEHA